MSVRTIVVGDEAALYAALRGAIGETEIQLRPGRYEEIRIRGYNPTAEITITSFDPSRRAEIDTLYIRDSSNLTFEELYFHHIKAPNARSVAQVSVRNSDDITFINDEFAGTVDNIKTNDASGLRIDDSSWVSILDSRFHDLTFSLYAAKSDHLVIAGNEVRKVREGFDFTGVDNVTIDKNLFTQFTPVLDGPRPDHPDGIQFWTSGSRGSNNVEITNNAFLFDNGVPIQGIFIGNEGRNATRHTDFTIANNVYEGQSRHGISVYYADDVRITGNTVVSAKQGGTGYYLDPAINTTFTTRAVVDNNISSMMFSRDDTRLVTYDNVDAFDYRSGVGVKFADLFAAGGTGPNEFLVKRGSVADRLDAGYSQVDRTGNWAAVTDALLAKHDAMLETAGSNYQIA